MNENCIKSLIGGGPNEGGLRGLSTKPKKVRNENTVKLHKNVKFGVET